MSSVERWRSSSRTACGCAVDSPLERALLASLAPEGVGKLPYGQLAVDGLVGWSVLVAKPGGPTPPEPDPKPNPRPWQHLGDIEQLAER